MNEPTITQAILHQILENITQQGSNLELQFLRTLDPQIIHTREQLKTLHMVINNMESLTKQADRPKGEEDGPTVLISDEQSQAAAAAIIMHASNRIIQILSDNSRWKPTPGGKTKKHPPIDPLEAETNAIARRQEVNERIANIICKKIEDGQLSITQNTHLEKQNQKP